MPLLALIAFGLVIAFLLVPLRSSSDEADTDDDADEEAEGDDTDEADEDVEAG